MPNKEFKIRKAKPGDETAIHEANMRSIRKICVKDHGENEVCVWGYRRPGLVDSGTMKFEDIGGHPVSACPMRFSF